GGGGTVFEGTFSFQNTIIAGNTVSSNFPEIEFFGGSITSAGNNLIGDATGDAANTGIPIIYLPSDIRDVNPRLAPLGVYGGQTLTALLLSSSPAINTGSATNAPTTDERGAARVGNVDIGAFELNNNENNGANAFRATLPATRISQPFSQTIVQSTNGFTYTLTNGSLPGGVTLSGAGGTLVLSGTPSQAGTFNFTLTATDGVTTTTNNYTLVIQAVTAASVNIAGRVLTRKGSGLVNAIVNLTDSNGNTRKVRTALNGRFAITEVASSSSYVLSVQSKRYQFNSQTLSATSDMSNIVFTAQ
ncbi:MAG: putative Ig domain-containing protein, partial [Pyrinomonadaceae bacterium]|nr:putative Ig domain-containing protein [Pyrinomonadaceae bacterium]